MCAVDLLRLAAFHQHVCLRLFLLFLEAAINLGTLAQAAAGTRVVTYPPIFTQRLVVSYDFIFLRGYYAQQLQRQRQELCQIETFNLWRSSRVSYIWA